MGIEFPKKINCCSKRNEPPHCTVSSAACQSYALSFDCADKISGAAEIAAYLGWVYWARAARERALGRALDTLSLALIPYFTPIRTAMCSQQHNKALCTPSTNIFSIKNTFWGGCGVRAPTPSTYRGAPMNYHSSPYHKACTPRIYYSLSEAKAARMKNGECLSKITHPASWV